MGRWRPVWVESGHYVRFGSMDADRNGWKEEAGLRREPKALRAIDTLFSGWG